eukprot:TRINITY_DN6764_c0_g1_i1.p1 TRINITY_DN6764_c0_g1~~TRINITY_DN6764_c0_g1_i1.p1  ORF type:complete len:134 (-),score=14.16 TRINITY_DN6764_c0_g1_i1:62-463(-)
MDPLETAGFKLPAEVTGLECIKYIWPAMECFGPSGSLKSMYREGKTADCSRPWRNLRTCMSIKFEKSAEKQQELLAQRIKDTAPANAPSRAPVWHLRTQPPASFAKYQDMSKSEKDEIFRSIDEAGASPEVNP